MDKSRKKEILNKYKKDELEKLSQSDNKILADFAKNKLGFRSAKLTLERLRNTQDDKLIETITNKIKEVIDVRYKADPKRYKNPDNVIYELTESLKAVHFTNIFEMYVSMGDTEKFFEGAIPLEITETANGYRLLNLDNVADNISVRSIGDIEKELGNEDKIHRRKIEYVRRHLNEFELN